MASFWHAGKELPDDMRLAYYDALLQYGFTQTFPENMHSVASALMITNKPTLDISWTRYLAKHGKTKRDQNENKTGSSANQMKETQKQKGGKEEGRRKKEEGERKNNPPLSPPAGDKPKRKNKTGMTTDWFPTESGYEYAKQYGIEDTALAVDIFKDWAIAGNKTYADWQLTWKSACRDWLPEKVLNAQANQARGKTNGHNHNPEPEPQHAEPPGWLEYFLNAGYPTATVKSFETDYGNQWDRIPARIQGHILVGMGILEEEF